MIHPRSTKVISTFIYLLTKTTYPTVIDPHINVEVYTDFKNFYYFLSLLSLFIYLFYFGLMQRGFCKDVVVVPALNVKCTDSPLSRCGYTEKQCLSPSAYTFLDQRIYGT